ncbi:transcriptional regulator, LacI family [Sphingobium sp. AP50]|uniref:LacI family DNA-binding transcriptional regulator n=1 Tax=Sphingobium sp. AP50 TaxID=1884369 RepID=UPI0008BBFF70|nr:LacI family DNA-binding transcriptional regulator [Sphingobium sp. AP50]SEK00883.1 transcriptional regulator, LacI family [Sphingobium sp. AP50]
MKQYATLHDVATAAGMSRAQVSRALRGDPGVKEATRARIAEIARTVGYRPNIAARTLASARTTIVGVVIGEPDNPFHISLASAIETQLLAAGFDAIISMRGINDASALEEAERLIALRSLAAILISTPHSDDAILKMAGQMPCVFIGRRTGHLSVHSISVDDEGGAAQAVEHLVGLGHRRIAHIGSMITAGAIGRTEGYRRAMAAAGLEPMEYAGPPDSTTGRNGADALLARSRPPTAIFAYNDLIAIGAMNGLHTRGLRVPDDISVIGFDDTPLAATEMISLTSLRQNPVEQASAALHALQAILRNEPVPGVMIPVELRIRRSVGPPPVRK